MNPARILKSAGRELLQFLNLREPREDGKTLLSLSKLAIWVSLLVSTYVAIKTPDHAAEIIAAFNVPSLLNYIYRRKVQKDTIGKVP